MTHPVCMIVEDQALLGLSLEAYLEETGFEVAGPFFTNAEALRWLEAETPDLALLDIMLKDGTSVRIARILKDRGVPFAIYSGLRPEAQGPPEFQDVPWLEKPVGRDALWETLQQLKRSKARSAARP
jgi:two-component SAPR family response regulator